MGTCKVEPVCQLLVLSTSVLQSKIFGNVLLYDARGIYFQIDPRNVQESDGDFVTISARVTLEERERAGQRKREKEKQRKKVVGLGTNWRKIAPPLQAFICKVNSKAMPLPGRILLKQRPQRLACQWTAKKADMCLKRQRRTATASNLLCMECLAAMYAKLGIDTWDLSSKRNPNGQRPTAAT